MVDLFIGGVALFLFLKKKYIFSPFPLFLSVYVYALLCDFVFIGLLLPFILGLCLFIFLLLFLFFLSSFSSEPCGWQGLGALAGCQA